MSDSKTEKSDNTDESGDEDELFTLIRDENLDSFDDDELFALVRVYEIQLSTGSKSEKRKEAIKYLKRIQSRKISYMGTSHALSELRVACSNTSTPKEAMEHLNHHDITDVGEIDVWALIGDECKLCGGTIEAAGFDRFMGGDRAARAADEDGENSDAEQQDSADSFGEVVEVAKQLAEQVGPAVERAMEIASEVAMQTSDFAEDLTDDGRLNSSHEEGWGTRTNVLGWWVMAAVVGTLGGYGVVYLQGEINMDAWIGSGIAFVTVLWMVYKSRCRDCDNVNAMRRISKELIDSDEVSNYYFRREKVGSSYYRSSSGYSTVSENYADVKYVDVTTRCTYLVQVQCRFCYYAFEYEVVESATETYRAD